MRLLPERVLTPEGWLRDAAVAVTDGRIAAVGPAGAPQPGDVRLDARALLPGTVNAHAHAFQSLLRGLGDDLDFMGWRDRVLYPFSARLDREAIGLGAAFAFADMLRHGVTTCVDFFYLHDAGNDNAEAVIAAAREVGIRLVLARSMYDWEGAPVRYRETPADAARRTRELIAAHRHDPTVTVQPAPHSPHGASPAMIRAGWEVAEAEDTPFHIHVAEGRYEGERLLREHGATPVRHLERLGVLGPRTLAVHCVWLDDEEIALMGARGAALAYCPSSNMFLGDGITRLPELLRAGVRVGLGSDGGCTNNRLSVFEEMRMASLLQRVRLLDGAALSAARAFALGTEGSAAIVRLPAGRIAPGALADFVAVDLGHPSLHPPTDLLASVVYAMSPQAVTDVWVHGERGVVNGRLTRLSEAELLERVRALTRDWRLP
jgi:5-methylthioadenosine/S-adenosylhomocysteine deaminase